MRSVKWIATALALGLRSVRVYSTVRVVTQHISAAYTSAVAVSNDEETVVRVASEHLPW